MRVFAFANNEVGAEVVRCLRDSGATIVGLAVHPERRGKCRTEIIAASGVAPENVFEGPCLKTAHTVAHLRALAPDIGVSALFGYILRADLLNLFPQGCVNLHPSLLPYNRGAYPNVWSIIDSTPAGVTLHYMDEGIDTGDLIAQQKVPVEAIDDGASLYRKLERASVELFRATWPKIVAGAVIRTPQVGEGTTHMTADVSRLDEVSLEETYTGRELIDLIRARTFPPHRGVYFREGDRKVYLELRLSYGNE